MRRPMAKKVLAASMAAAMTMSFAACGGSTPAASTEAPAASTETTPAASTEEVVASTEEEVSPYPVLKDANGNVYDLGGIEVTIRDWWSSGDPVVPANDMQEAQEAYREWAQETYNFTIRQVAVSDWGSTPADFVDYATSGGDDNNYVFVLRADPAVTSAMANGLMYDLSTLDCLDFSEAKFQNNKCHELFSLNGGIYAAATGYSEPRGGLYFNKRILGECGIDPESIYDMQANDTWTWDAWEAMLETVQAKGDTNNDGEQDIWGIGVNEGNMVKSAVFSNGGSYVKMNAEGKYEYNLESAETLEALEWSAKIFTLYDWNGPEGAAWDYYKEQWLAGGCAFLPDDYYCMNPGAEFAGHEDEIGWVAFPKGPSSSAKLCQVSSDNPFAIPACYDADRAWKIAFAWNQYSEPIPGYEDFNNWEIEALNGNRDARTCHETVPLLTANSEVNLADVIPGFDVGAPFLWKFGPGAVVSEIVDGFRDLYKTCIDEANGN